MLYTRLMETGWRWDVSIDLRQWMIGFNFYDQPWPMWNVFIGPLRVGAARER